MIVPILKVRDGRKTEEHSEYIEFNNVNIITAPLTTFHAVKTRYGINLNPNGGITSHKFLGSVKEIEDYLNAVNKPTLVCEILDSENRGELHPDSKYSFLVLPITKQDFEIAKNALKQE